MGAANSTATAESPRKSEVLPQSLAIAEALLQDALRRMTGAEKRHARTLHTMLTDAPGKAFTFAAVDEVFRSTSPRIQAEHWRHLLQEFGMPRWFSALDRSLVSLATAASRLFPGLIMPQIEARMRRDSQRVILNAAQYQLRSHVGLRREQGFSLNLNQLGEAVLGEAEASNRLDAVIRLLKEPHVRYVSVKVSSIHSQINPAAWDETLDAIKSKLRKLYRAAQEQDGFVNLDMEEYRDLELTMCAFCEVLNEGEFLTLPAGIVLQAYLPDSWRAQQQLAAWSQRRIEKGGVPIKFRIVKGANLAMERVEAELHGWNAAPYQTKADTDANFRRMLEFGCQPQNAAAVRLGVASHNLFDVALALVLRQQNGVEDNVEIEMLEGMANHQARAVKEKAGGLLLYAPMVHSTDFMSAMAYLVRRLDENTAPENFLRDLFGLIPGSAEWQSQQRRFVNGWNERADVPALPWRSYLPTRLHRNEFHNEPDSDFTQRPTRDRVDSALAEWQPSPMPQHAEIDDVLGRATAAFDSWRKTTLPERAALLNDAASIMAEDRCRTIACLQAEGRKAITEADVEVSEAIDFARYYARTFVVPDNVMADPLGVVVVTPPWNFPYAIPCGGVLAALIAGNAVVLKPAPEVRQIGWHLANQLWQAGIPRDVLQFAACEDGAEGKKLITDDRVSAVVLTGAWQTAKLFQAWRPSLNLFAETSGKNALIITRKADRELAVKDLVKSAFSHSGQKCSAASLAIVEAEVYDDPVFQRQLRDATESLPVGPSTRKSSIITPLIQAPSNQFRRALTTLDDGERWLLKPTQPTSDPCLWTPGIRLNVRPGSWFHRTECFGPVLGVMRAPNLTDAIAWQNATDFGLTAGLHSLDPREHQFWKDRVQAGNLYINRPITGAIVQRQPFGGWKRSSIGPGAKAGGPNYPLLFATFRDAATADQDETCVADAQLSYSRAWKNHFSREHDPSALKCESNVFRYRPCRGVLLRLQDHREIDIERAKLASLVCRVPLDISIAGIESDAEFAARLKTNGHQFEFLRTIAPPCNEVLAAAHETGVNWINAPITSCGRIELRYWLREQSISTTLHRYGQLPEWLPPSRRIHTRAAIGSP